MRTVARALIGACLIAACGPRDQAPKGPTAATPTAATSALFAYAIEPVGPGIYAFVQPVQRGGLVSGNSLVVVGDDGVLVVDTGHFPSLARKMVADIRRLTDKPVRWVVTTHWHPDHLFGNAAFSDAFPGVTFLAHAETRRLVLARDLAFADKQRNPTQTLERYRVALANGTRPNGVPLSSDERQVLALTVPALEQTLGDADVTVVPPTMTFDDSVTIHLGKREVRVLHLGRGNTAGDAMVYVPDAKVLATGDVVVAPTPYAYGSYFGEWIGVLQKIEAMDARIILPGHGPIMRDPSYVKTLESLFSSVRAQARDAALAGLSLEETRKKIDVETFRRALSADDARDRFVFDVSFVEPGVERAYQEAKGKLEDE